MKQDLHSNAWISTENLSEEINPKAYRGEVLLIFSLKILSENLNSDKIYGKINLTVFILRL